MPQSEGAIVKRPTARETPASERNQAAIELLGTWLREDAPSFSERLFEHLSDEPDSWELLKAELDRDRPSERKLFR